MKTPTNISERTGSFSIKTMAKTSAMLAIAAFLPIDAFASSATLGDTASAIATDSVKVGDALLLGAQVAGVGFIIAALVRWVMKNRQRDHSQISYGSVFTFLLIGTLLTAVPFVIDTSSSTMNVTDSTYTFE